MKASVDTDLEDLMSHLGEFGKYQAWQFFLHIIAALTAGLHMLTLVTVAAVPPHYCADQSARTISTPASWNDSAPLDFASTESCSYRDADNETRNCESWVYDTTYFESSRGIEWNFVCSRRWMSAAAQSSYMFGVLVGALTLGNMADKYGRKKIFCFSAVAQLVLGVLVALTPEFYTFLVIRFLYGIFGSAGAYITGFVLTMELVGPKLRTVCGVAFQAAFAVGFMLVAAWGALIKDRMWLQVVYGSHGLLLLGHLWLMDESPRWLWAQGRTREAVDVIRKGLKMNGKELEIDTTRALSGSKISREAYDEKVGERRRYTMRDLFATPNLRKKSMNVCFNFFANSIAYYGLSLNTGNLVGNPYLMLFLSGLVELPSYVVVCCLMDRTGRRSLISTFMLVGGACCIAVTSVPQGSPAIVIATVMLGKAFIAGSFAIIYNYCAELFPTVLRNTALGITSTCARLSGTLTPMIILLDSFDPKVPTMVFGLLAIVAGLLALYLPETLNQPMPETVEDGENFGKGDTCFSACRGRDRRRESPSDMALRKMNAEEEKANDA